MIKRVVFLMVLVLSGIICKSYAETGDSYTGLIENDKVWRSTPISITQNMVVFSTAGMVVGYIVVDATGALANFGLFDSSGTGVSFTTVNITTFVFTSTTQVGTWIPILRRIRWGLTLNSWGSMGTIRMLYDYPALGAPRSELNRGW